MLDSDPDCDLLSQFATNVHLLLTNIVLQGKHNGKSVRVKYKVSVDKIYSKQEFKQLPLSEKQGLSGNVLVVKEAGTVR